MKIITILSWYDESPAWLAATISSIAHFVQPDHLIAVDGAYLLLPGGRAFSGFEQHNVIHEMCRTHEIGLTLHAPREPWMGNEVEKRSFAFQLAEQVIDGPQDWYFIMDADEIITYAPGNLRDKLADTDEDIGTTWAYERFDPFAGGAEISVAQKVNMPREPRCPAHKFLRALPRLRLIDNHYTYMHGNGKVLWCNNGANGTVDTQVELEHRTRLRDLARKEQQDEYYRRRNEMGIEQVYRGTELGVITA